MTETVMYRWNGASDIDFPRVRKVDHNNASAISQAIIDTIANYERIIQSLYEPRRSPTIFLSYILSMWRRSHYTVDAFFGSSSLHYILSPSSLAFEVVANFKILTILMMFPLASIDLYVQDPLWYIRHHYKFFTMLKTAGYIRFDPLDASVIRDSHVSSSYVRILPLSRLSSNKGEWYDTGNMNSLMDIIPPWNPLSIVLDSTSYFEDPDILFNILHILDDQTSLMHFHDSGGAFRGELKCIHHKCI